MNNFAQIFNEQGTFEAKEAGTYNAVAEKVELKSNDNWQAIIAITYKADGATFFDNFYLQRANGEYNTASIGIAKQRLRSLGIQEVPNNVAELYNLLKRLESKTFAVTVDKKLDDYAGDGSFKNNIKKVALPLQVNVGFTAPNGNGGNFR